MQCFDVDMDNGRVYYIHLCKIITDDLTIPETSNVYDIFISQKEPTEKQMELVALEIAKCATELDWNID